MNKSLRLFPAYLGAIFTFVVSIIVFKVFAGSLSDSSTSSMAQMAAFLFGIFASFTISNKYTRLTSISELLKIDEANLLAIYKYSKEFGPSTVKKVRELMDHNLISQLDYYLVDYRHSSKSYYALFDYMLTLKADTAEKTVAYEQINILLTTTSSNRKQVETLVLQRTSSLEWISLWSLFGLLYLYILGLNTGSLFSILASATMTTVAMLLLFVLRDLDTLSWQQNQWIWQPLHDLFLDLDLLPYYPEDALLQKEAKPPLGSKVRIAHYKSAYPNVAEKEIELKVIA